MDIFSEDYKITVSCIEDGRPINWFYKVYIKDEDTVNDHVIFIVKYNGISFLVDCQNDPDMELMVTSKKTKIMDLIEQI